MFQLFVYVPKSHLEEVKSAMFAAGAGRSTRYEQCAWEALGEGQFVPLRDSNPHIGNANTLTRIAEYKLEMVCGEGELKAVVSAMKRAHPYEEPAYGAISLMEV